MVNLTITNKEAEQKEQLYKKSLMFILENIHDGIYVIKKDYTIEFMNKTLIDDLGTGVGEKCYEIIYHRDQACPWCKAREVWKGEIIRWEHYVQELDKTFHVTEIPLPSEEGTISKLSILKDLTAIKKGEKRVRASEADYKRLFEHVGCGVYISTKEGKFLDANQALLDMLGYQNKEEFLKIDLYKDLYLRPEDRRKFQEIIEREGKVVDYEMEFKRKDGTSILVLNTSHVRYDEEGNVTGYEGINLDQTQRKQMEQKLKEAHDFLTQIIQSSPDSIVATDLKGNIIIWNQAAEETFGYKAEDVISKMNVIKIYPEGAAQNMLKILISPDYGGVGKLRSYPMTFVKEHGESVEGNLSAALVYDALGKPVASVGVIVDLKDRIAIEQKLRKTQEQLLQAEKLAAMGRLTSQIAHELNNPLYGIMNTLDLMKSEIPPESKRRKILEMALTETTRLTDLLRKMLSFSKPEEEEKQVVDINTILDEVLILHEKQLWECSIRVTTSFTRPLAKVYASKNQLRQVFLNIIANARDAMPYGGSLDLKTIREGEMIVIDISDSGIGIPEENITKIFDAFFTTKNSVKDAGLGLSVCYGIIKSHGGDIKVESEVGSNTTFTINFPVYDSPESK